MILADPECAWEELVPIAKLECTDPKLREWELNLRKRIFWNQGINDDDTVEPWFDIPWVVHIGDFGVPTPKTHGANRGSYTWDPPLKDLRTATKQLKYRELSVDRALTRQHVEAAKAIFGDILPVRIRGKYWWTVGMTQPVIEMIGLETLMLAMYDQPDEIHALMSWFSGEYSHFLEWFEMEGIIGTKNGDHAWFVGFAPADDPKIVVAVMIEFGGHGTRSAHIASKIIEHYLKKATRQMISTEGDE